MRLLLESVRSHKWTADSNWIAEIIVYLPCLSPKAFCLGKGKELTLFPVSPVNFCQFEHCLMGQITRAGYYCVTAQQGWWVLHLPLHSDVKDVRGSAQSSCKSSLVYLLQNGSRCVLTRGSVY